MSEGVVAELKDRFIIVPDPDLATMLNDAQRVPVPLPDRAAMIFDQLAYAFDDPVETDVLLDRAGPKQVIVAVITGSPYQAAAHIGFA